MSRWATHFQRVSRRAQSADFGAADFGASTVTVGDVQVALNAQGASPQLATDGVAGPATAAAVRAFQTAKSLQVDGRVGPQTLAALGFNGATAMVTGKPTGAAPSSGGSIASAVNSLVDQAVDILVPGLRDAVAKAWIRFNTPNEGYEDYMYTDALGLVTTGMGNLIEVQGQNAPDPIVYQLPWKHRGSQSPASRAEIDAAWHTVKSAFPGVKSTGCKGLTDLYLEPAAIDQLVQQRLAANQNTLLQMFPQMPTWPADGQMATHSMSWAMGTGDPATGTGGVASFKTLRSALTQSPPDFTTAANQSHMKGVGIDARNAANKQMFLNAAAVQAKGANPNNLYFPGAVVETAIVAGLGLAGVLGMLAAAVLAFVGYQNYQATGNVLGTGDGHHHRRGT